LCELQTRGVRSDAVLDLFAHCAGQQVLEALTKASEAVEDATHRLGQVDGRRHPDLVAPLIEQLRVAQRSWVSALADVYRAAFGTSGPDRQYRYKFHPATLEPSPYPVGILYAADVLHAGGLVNGSVPLSDHLRPLATRLVRLTARLRLTLVHAEEDAVPLHLQLSVLDKAWVEFEWAYLDVFASPAPPALTEAWLAYTVQLSETLLLALREQWTEPAEVERIDPALVIAVARAALLQAARAPAVAAALWPLFHPDAATPSSSSSLTTPASAPRTPTDSDAPGPAAAAAAKPPPPTYDRLVASATALPAAAAHELLRAIFVPHAVAVADEHRELFLLLCAVLEQLQHGPGRAGHALALRTAFGMHLAPSAAAHAAAVVPEAAVGADPPRAQTATAAAAPPPVPPKASPEPARPAAAPPPVPPKEHAAPAAPARPAPVVFDPADAL